MHRILIAACSEALCSAFTENAANCFEIEVCHDGNQMLARYRACKPDILILDTELPGLDGISALSTIRNTGHKVPVIALTVCVQSTYLLQMASVLGIACIVPKPCTAYAVLKKVHEILECCGEEKQTVDLDRSIELVLLELHFNTQLCGYPCVVEAIKQMIADPLAQITKSVYPEVAKICGGGDKRVEHAMRSCIRDAWKHRNEEIWQMYFPSDRKIQTAPANGQFIARIAKCFAGKEAHQQKPLANGSEN